MAIDVIINEFKASIRLMDGEAVLSPDVVARLTEVITEAVLQRMERDGRRNEERRIGSGASSWRR